MRSRRDPLCLYVLAEADTREYLGGFVSQNFCLGPNAQARYHGHEEIAAALSLFRQLIVPSYCRVV